MQSHYRLNVSRNGKHFFATAENSLTFEDEAKAALAVFREKFPVSEGYHVQVTYWSAHGSSVSWGFTDEERAELEHTARETGMRSNKLIA